MGDELLISLEFELLLHLVRFVDVVADFPLQLFRDVVLLCQTTHDLEVLVFCSVLGTDVVYQVSHAVDIVGQQDAAKSLDHGEADCLLVVCWRDVSETDSQHDCRAPVVGPDVLFVPDAVILGYFYQPVIMD